MPKTRATKKNRATKAPTVSKPDRADPVEKALAEVVRLNSQELGLAVLYQHRAAELANVRAARGDQLLASEDPGSAAMASGRRVAELAEAMEAIADASIRARSLRLAAIPLVFAAQADEADRVAAELEAEAAALEVRSDELRAVLEEHDGCGYSPTTPMTPDRAMGAGGGAVTVVVYRLPRFELLRMRARERRNEATQYRLKTAHMAGSVEADDLDALLEVVFSEAVRIGPPIDAIRTWADNAVEKERRRRERVSEGADFVPVAAPMRLHLEFRAGVIDQAASRVLSPEPTDLSAYFDSAAAIDAVLAEVE